LEKREKSEGKKEGEFLGLDLSTLHGTWKGVLRCGSVLAVVCSGLTYSTCG